MLTFLCAVILAGLVITLARAQQATVEVVPASYTVPNVGLTFNVNVTIQNVENLTGYQFDLYYPNDILNGTSVTEGPFLKAGGTSTFFDLAEFTDDYNTTCGVVNVLDLNENDTGVSGSGTLVTITFKSTSTNGTGTLNLAGVMLSDPNGGPISFTSADGEVTVVSEFPLGLLLPLLMALTLVALALGKKIRNHRIIFHSV
jgi:hypothetical protein